MLLLMIVALAGCTSGNADDGAAPNESSSTPDSVTSSPPDSVAIRLIAYRPDVLRVPAGTRVTWNQEDPGAHTVTSGVVEPQPGGVVAKPDGRFDSGEIAEGRSFSLALDQPGTYAYFCSIHPSTMRGELQVF